jgi:predicted DNA-binding transcriptional regulator YafY
MSDQPKVERLLRIMKMLSSGFGQTLGELAGKLDMSQRTVYRYIDSLRNAGFIIQKEQELFRIDRESPYLKDISDLLHFTREESWILNKAILALDEESVIKQNLANKLYALYDLKGVPYPVVRRENSDKVILLIRAIEGKVCVIFRQYQSSNSASVSDRWVEPYGFTLNYGYIWCYEHDTASNKLFKTARIGNVVLTGVKWEFEARHQMEPIDVFRIHGPARIRVSLIMTMRAANLLTEEYPMAADFIHPAENNTFRFSGWVTSFEGIGRFILGLMDDITVVSPHRLKTYLNRKVRGKIF